MPGPDPLSTFLLPLERLALPYCVTGSVAAEVARRSLDAEWRACDG